MWHMSIERPVAPVGRKPWEDVMQNLSGTNFVDPFERAFSMGVPAGWIASGGLLRHSPIDPSICVRVISPDLRTLIILGDPQVRLYTTPQLSFFGWPSQGEGGSVRNYLSGVDFARAYALGTLAKSYDNLVLIGQKPRPDLAAGPWVQFNPMARHDGGEVTFSCRQGGEEARGFVGADTYIYGWPAQGGVTWGVGLLVGFVAPPQGCDAATATMIDIMKNTRIDPAWLQRQKEISDGYAKGIVSAQQTLLAAAQANVERTLHVNQEIWRLQRESFGKRQEQIDAVNEEMREIVAGYSNYVDSAGTRYTLDNTKIDHFADNLGRTLATNDPNPPGWWERLKKAPRKGW